MVDLNTPLYYTDAMGVSLSTTLAELIAGNSAAVLTALGSAPSASFATAAQGALAASAAQPPVPRTALAGGFAKHFLVAGGAAGNFSVTGIETGDELDEVLYFVGAGTAVTDVQDLTSQFTISANGTINNTGGTPSTGGELLVRWTKLTA
jgi:hypothetical protein